MLLAGRLIVPEGISAVLFDLDGVLLDTLSVDYELVDRLLEREAGVQVEVPKSVIRKNFPYAVPDFWQKIAEACDLPLSPEALGRLVREHDRQRLTVPAPVHDGIREIISAIQQQRLSIAVVSNNPQAEVRATLAAASIEIDVIVGNDVSGLRRKPAPDTYQEAASRLGVAPSACVAVEDSLLGVEAAGRAGCYTIGVATGACSFTELSRSEYVSCCYTSFAGCYVNLGREGVTKKVLSSPNEFVSHMVEHVAWRLGCSIDLSWTNNNWHELGMALGREVRKLPLRRDAVATIGMIDDGSAEIQVRESEPGKAVVTASQQVDLNWFISCRAEQLENGYPLVEVLNGLAASGDLEINVKIASFEDPHHTWEGVFRGVGIALNKMFNEQPHAPVPPLENQFPKQATTVSRENSSESVVERGWTVQDVSPWGARLCRTTAESVVSLGLGLGEPALRCSIDVADSVDVTGLAELLDHLVRGAQIQLDVEYKATRLSSSHVVTEDIGLVLGRAFRQVAIERMVAFGIQGAGSSMEETADGLPRPVRVGVSMEGRKFWKYVPMAQDYPDFRKSFLVGHTLKNGLFSEDLDDFVDGLAGGFQASIIVHVDDGVNPEDGWPKLFGALGEAIAELLSVNPDRVALAAGVKATLA